MNREAMLDKLEGIQHLAERDIRPEDLKEIAVLAAEVAQEIKNDKAQAEPKVGRAMSGEHPPAEPPVVFHSPAEAYTYLLLSQNKLKRMMENIELQMSFVLMNIEKDNFNADYPHAKQHASKELGYLATSANRITTEASSLWTMAMQLHLLLNPEGNG